MAFGNIATFYLPVAGSAGSSQWGTDVRKLLDTPDAGTDNTTITNHGTGGAVTRTHDPYSTTSADLAQADYGYAVTPSDMNSVTGAVRFILAGTHTITVRIRNNTNTLAKSNCRLDVFVYRVGNAAGGRARTLIDSWSSALFSTAALNAFVTVTASKSLAEIVLGDDETLQLSTELNASGSAVTGETYTMCTGTNAGVEVRWDHPGLGTRYDRSLADSDVGVEGGDALTRLMLFPRALADSPAASDVLARSYIGARALDDSSAVSDVLTRVAIFPRALADNAPASDALARVFTGARSLADSPTVSDALQRQWVGARPLGDNAIVTDALTRQTVVGRALADSAPASDTLSRVTIFNRGLPDNAGVRNGDALLRQFAGARTLDDTPAVTDALTRQAVYDRQLEDSLSEGGGTVIRPVILLVDD